MSVKFRHYDLQLVSPAYGSKLTDLIFELDYLRKKPLGGSTTPDVFFQLKHLFHILESIGSARIEGNNTTLAEYIETKIDDSPVFNEGIREINNSEKALSFIDSNIMDNSINRAFISELHKIVVNELSQEGSKTPGLYRTINLSITGSRHQPPDYTKLDDYMEELLVFINQKHAEKYDLLTTAIAHHRFAWIHPFDNGNGRTVRLLTYAMLVKLGFRVNVGRIINPTAVFCSDRHQYYAALSGADSGKKEGILSWCHYVLSGLKKEIEKIDKLLDYSFLSKSILKPAIRIAKSKKQISDVEYRILETAISKQLFSSKDLEHIFREKALSHRSREIRKLRDKKLISRSKENKHKYFICFDNNYLLRGVIQMLGKNDFLPPNPDDKEDV